MPTHKNRIYGNRQTRRINKLGDPPSFKLNESQVKRVRKTKSLGIIIDEGFSWKDRYQSLKGKIFGGLSASISLTISSHNLCCVVHIMLSSRVTFAMLMLYGRPVTLTASSLVHCKKTLQSRISGQLDA